MARPPDQIVAAIRAFEPIAGNWLLLDDLLAELWANGPAKDHVGDLLAVFERFPEEAGGVMWGLLHGLEGLRGYELALVRSVQARPSEMGVTMIGRLLNSGVSEIADVPLAGLLREVAASTVIPAGARASAEGWA